MQLNDLSHDKHFNVMTIKGRKERCCGRECRRHKAFMLLSAVLSVALHKKLINK